LIEYNLLLIIYSLHPRIVPVTEPEIATNVKFPSIDEGTISFEINNMGRKIHLEDTIGLEMSITISFEMIILD